MPSPLGQGLINELKNIPNKLNYVIDAWANPCDAPLYVYVETALPVALDMLVAFFCFDISDLIRWIFRPAGLWPAGRIAGRPGRRGGRGRRGLGARVRSRVPLLKKIKGRPVSNGIKNLWRLDEIGQRFLFWWMVADIGATGLFNFTTIMYKTAWCQLAAAAGASAATTDGEEIGGAIPETLLWNTVDYSRGETFIFGGTVHLGPGTHRIIAGVNGNEHPAEGETYELIISVVSGPQAGQYTLDTHDQDPNNPRGLVGSHELDGEIDCFVQVKVTPNGGYKNYTAHCVAYSKTAMLPPEQMDCAWENYFHIIGGGKVARIAGAAIPQSAQDWYNGLPASRKA